MTMKRLCLTALLALSLMVAFSDVGKIFGI